MTPAFRTLLAVTLGVVTVAAAETATQYQTGAQWLIAVLLGVAFFVALCTAGAAVAAAVWGFVFAAVYEWRLARRIAQTAPPTTPLRLIPPSDPLPDPRTVTRDARLIGDYATETTPPVSPARHAAPSWPGTISHAALIRPVAVAEPSAQPWTAPVSGGVR